MIVKNWERYVALANELLTEIINIARSADSKKTADYASWISRSILRGISIVRDARTMSAFVRMMQCSPYDDRIKNAYNIYNEMLELITMGD